MRQAHKSDHKGGAKRGTKGVSCPQVPMLLMSFDVGKSRISEFLTMRDLTKSGTKEELAI